MDTFHIIDNKFLSLTTIKNLVIENKKLKLADETITKISKCRTYLNQKITKSKEPIYGINTGFGSLCDVKIDTNNLQQLQENLVKSHACGTGDKVPQEIVKLMLLLKIQSLSYGHSGVQLITVQRLIDFYNNDVLPVIYTQGSLGASGDLAPLAHLSLPLIGEGKVYYKNKIVDIITVLEEFKWQKIDLQSKEGLALLNGTQFMSAYGISNLIKAHKLSYLADVISAISIDAFDGRISPFNELIHLIRPHNGQLETAERIRDLLTGSQLITKEKVHVQDPYSFRCIPQVHGATKDTINFVTKTFETEINSVTDNPNIFVEDDVIISGGNFHGQPLALGADYLAIALSELGNISERRIYQLVSGLRGLPNFLVTNSGLNSGFMIPQYTAASIVSQNKQLATPASIDSIVSSNGQEDHVSMGANSATKCKQVVDNVERILAIELFNTSQALSFREPLKTADFLQSFIQLFRTEVPLVDKDRILHYDIENAILFLQTFNIEI